MATTAPVASVVQRILTPRERLSISQWAVNKPFLILEKGAVYPGPYDLSLTPYWREPLDAAGDSAVRKINIVKAPQCGGTKCAEIVLAWHLENQPTNWMYIRPAEPDLDEAFRDRFKPIIERNLPDLVPTSGSWVVLSKNQRIELTNAIIYGAAASVPRQITSRTTPKALYDETDTGGDTSNALGNVLDLVDERQMAGTSAMSLTMGVSSPKYDSGSNWVAYDQRSDRREYWEPCPCCGHYQPLVWESFIVEGDERDGLTIINDDLARYRCKKCEYAIEPSWQGWMSDRGVWVPRDQRITEPLPIDDDAIRDERSLAILPDVERWEPEREGKPRTNPHRGYRVWAANTKFEQRGWSSMMARWFEVARTRDPERIQVFVNSWKAQPWKQSIKSADEQTILRRKGAYEPRVVPGRAKLLLGAVDIQMDHLWYSFRAFGPNQDSWLIHYGTVEVANDDYQSALDTVYQMAFYQGWPAKGEGDLRMRAYALAVDSGFRTDEAYEFSRRAGVIAVKGEDLAKYRVRLVQVEGKKRPDPVDLYHLNMQVFKNRLQRALKQPNDEQHGFWLHCEVSDEYIQHLAAEEMKPRRSNAKLLTWQIKSQGRPNHLLDCEAYTLGLAEALEQRREVSVMTLREDDPAMGTFVSGQSPIGEPQPRKRRTTGRGKWLPDAPGFKA